MDVLAGSAVTLWVDFLDPTGTLIADLNSVTYTLFATDGTQLVASTPVVTAATDTGVSITIAASNNTIAGSRQFEKRTVIVRMTSAGRPYLFQTTYRVLPFLNMSVSADDVRSVFGASIDEVTDDEVDLVSAYFYVADAVVKVNAAASLATALATGNLTEIYANQAIAGAAVIALLPGLQGKLALERKDGQMSFKRSDIKWKQVESQALGLISRGVAAAAGISTNTVNFLATAESDDPVTFWDGVKSWP